MAVGHEDHGRIPMAVAAMLAGAVHQALDLALGEVAALDCQVYDAWGAFPGYRFHADKASLLVDYCIYYTLFLNSLQPETALGIVLTVDPCWSRWTSGRQAHLAMIVIAQFPCETPRRGVGGGALDFQKSVWPL